MVDITSNKWKEECGVFGVFSRTEDVSMLTYLGLYALNIVDKKAQVLQ